MRHKRSSHLRDCGCERLESAFVAVIADVLSTYWRLANAEHPWSL
jgi:hypothetical protein